MIDARQFFEAFYGGVLEEAESFLEIRKLPDVQQAFCRTIDTQVVKAHNPIEEGDAE